MKTESYPLSPMQQGMLFHHLSTRDIGVDIEQIYCTTAENLDVRLFKEAWQFISDRHAILRTTFHWDGGVEPWQTVHTYAALDFQFEDWRGKSPQEQQGMFASVLESERQRGFDLRKKPPMRVALFRMDNASYRFLWTFHHLLLDGRSVVMVLNELFTAYELLARGEPLELPVPRPYREYIDWLGRQGWSPAEAFWRQYLKDFTTPTLPATAHPAAQGVRPLRGEQEISLTESVSAALSSMARQIGVTTNTVLQSAWALLLSRYTREEDVVFGVVRACRRSSVAAADTIVGLFINTVPLRIRIAPEVSLATWLGTVRKAWRALRDFEHSPLAEIQGWSQVPRGQPLFETIFNYQDPSWDSALLAQGGDWERREFGICSQSNYPLVVDAYGGRSLLIKILYQRSRFDDDTIARMLGHFKTLLESMAANPEERVGQLPMLTEAERDQIMGRSNETRAECPQDKCAHHLFEEQVARTPHALAVADEQTRLSYAELNEQAGVIADELRRAGVGVDVCVGVCLDRSTKMVIAKLAVWKAGGAYVPLDPLYPAQRLKFMLEDAGMPVLLTQASLLDQLQFETAHLRVLCVDELLRKPKGRAKSRRTDVQTSFPPVSSTPEVQSSSSLAYVIYTSGSTGRPKGVEIEHRSLVNLLTWHQRTYSVMPQDRATQIATPAFDASVWELWPYLTRGASIHIPDEATRLSPKQLAHWLVEKQITLAFIPTPIAETMLGENWPDKCVLRHLLTGGDRLHRPPPKNLPFPLSNHYGPTENTVVTTSAMIPPMEENAGPPPIGRPVSNTQVYILDPGLLPVPIGVPGELWITGMGIARGYRNQRGLTREKFIPNPFGEDPNSRMYKTGDLVRWRTDGQIEFLGRLDHQVKIRGQRIELGEIESVLSNQPDVLKAVVVPRENARGEPRLAAYVVPKIGASWQPELLRKSRNRY